MTQRKREIEEQLRRHPRAAFELNALANNMPEETPLAQFTAAQRWVIDYVARVFDGDVGAFFNQYATGRINRTSIIAHAGRATLGIGPETPANYPVYS